MDASDAEVAFYVAEADAATGRRPQFQDLLVAEWVDDPLTKGGGAGQYVHRYATAEEKVVAVRRGVESGTIKGSVVDHEYGKLIIIPVSDGGSET